MLAKLVTAAIVPVGWIMIRIEGEGGSIAGFHPLLAAKQIALVTKLVGLLAVIHDLASGGFFQDKPAARQGL